MNRPVYLILGASSDVGEAFLKKLNSEGQATVIAHYASNEEKLIRLSEKLDQLTIQRVKADLSDTAQVEELIKRVQEIAVPTHIVHLAAPAFQYMKLKQWDEELVKKQMQISFFSFASVCKAFLPVMAKQKYGKVLVMLSSYTIGVPPKFMADYVAVKYALLGFVKAMAAEYGDKGININGISPNMMETKFLDHIDERVVEMTAAGSVMKRNITTDEVAEGMLYLLSDKCSYMNGINLNLSGGDRM